MASKLARGVAGILLVLLGGLAIAGKSLMPQPGQSPTLTWIGLFLLGAIMLGGFASAAYEVGDSLRHKRLDIASLATMLVLGVCVLLFALLLLAGFMITPLDPAS